MAMKRKFTIRNITNDQAIYIANLALDRKLQNPYVHRWVDYGVRCIIIAEDLETTRHVKDFFLNPSFNDVVEIDSDFTVREFRNTLCNGMKIYEYIKELQNEYRMV